MDLNKGTETTREGCSSKPSAKVVSTFFSTGHGQCRGKYKKERRQPGLLHRQSTPGSQKPQTSWEEELEGPCSLVYVSVLGHVQLFATLWTTAHQGPLSMAFSRQEYWSRLPFPPPGDLLDPGIEPASLASPALPGRFFSTEPPRKPHLLVSVQFSSVAQSCLTLCDPMNRSTPGLLVHHQLPEFTQTHVHRVSDAIQPSHPLSSPSPPAPNPSQHHTDI